MIILVTYSVTAFLLLMYLAYPLFLRLLPPSMPEKGEETAEVNEVSLVLLSYNGRKYLREKINFLLKELDAFPRFELIIIDDKSSDGGREVIREFESHENVEIVLKEEQRGIPHTMNMGVEMAKYQCIIFCDQRQAITRGSLKKLVEPLRDPQTGAVSSCISPLDKTGCCSWIRKYENFIKAGQSRTGSLIGVYGPLYAIRKRCYQPIPEDIILDDLYLTLRVLRSKKVLLSKDCQISDESFSSLNNLQRARRYIAGFIQILNDKMITKQLSHKQLIMLLWHKYLRLLIPAFLLASYVLTGIQALNDLRFLLTFALMSLLIAAGLLTVFLRIRNGFTSLVNLNLYYLAGIISLFSRKLLFGGSIPRQKQKEGNRT